MLDTRPDASRWPWRARLESERMDWKIDELSQVWRLVRE
jgi:hypothetical protein